MKNIMENILERLSEMFPKQDYQSRLEAFIASRNPKSPGEIEHLEREYYYNATRSVI